MRFEEESFGICMPPMQLAKLLISHLSPPPPPPPPPPSGNTYFHESRASVLLRTKADVGFGYSYHFFKPVTKSKLFSLNKRVYKSLAVNQSERFG